MWRGGSGGGRLRTRLDLSINIRQSNEVLNDEGNLAWLQL